MRLVIISLDACASDNAQELLALPNLGALAREGVFCDNVQTVYPTLTYPIHTSIATGCYPDKHGIGHNEIYDESDPPEFRPWNVEESRIRRMTLFRAACLSGRTVATLLWPVTGQLKKKRWLRIFRRAKPYEGIRYNFPEAVAVGGENQTLKVLRYGSMRWLLKCELKYGKTRPSTRQPHLDAYALKLLEDLIAMEYDERSAEFAHKEVKPSRRRMRQTMPDVMAIHLVDADAMKHQYGADSAEAQAAHRRLDEKVGAVVAALRQRMALEDTAICVVSDHGQRNVTGSVNLTRLLKDDGVGAAVHTLGFGAYIHVERPYYQRVYSHLCANMARYRLSHVYSREELRELHAPKDILLAVEAEDGVEILDHDGAEPHQATHGFGLHVPQAKTLLWLAGPMFKKNAVLKQARVVDIAPTLAEAVGLPFAACDGRVLRETFVSEGNA